MESDTFTKKYNFRLPDRVIEHLDKMIEAGKARNRTEALILIVDASEKLTDDTNIEKKITDTEKRQDKQQEEIEELKTRMEAMSKAFELYLLVSDGENKNQAINNIVNYHDLLLSTKLTHQKTLSFLHVHHCPVRITDLYKRQCL